MNRDPVVRLPQRQRTSRV